MCCSSFRNQRKPSAIFILCSVGVATIQSVIILVLKLRLLDKGSCSFSGCWGNESCRKAQLPPPGDSTAFKDKMGNLIPTAHPGGLLPAGPSPNTSPGSFRPNHPPPLSRAAVPLRAPGGGLMSLRKLISAACVPDLILSLTTCRWTGTNGGAAPVLPSVLGGPKPGTVKKLHSKKTTIIERPSKDSDLCF